jgi:hypothetical protein
MPAVWAFSAREEGFEEALAENSLSPARGKKVVEIIC